MGAVGDHGFCRSPLCSQALAQSPVNRAVLDKAPNGRQKENHESYPAISAVRTTEIRTTIFGMGRRKKDGAKFITLLRIAQNLKLQNCLL